MTASTPRIFISHSHADNVFGRQLVADLRARLGSDAVWYDASGGLKGGDQWWSEIVAQISARDTFIVILTPEAMSSRWVRDEMNVAWRLKNQTGKTIVPIVLHPCERRADFATLQEVSFVTPRPYGQAFAELLIVLGVGTSQDYGAASSEWMPVSEMAQRLVAEIHSAFGAADWKLVLLKSDLLIDESEGSMPPEVWRERATAYLSLGDGAKAIEALDRALMSNFHDLGCLRLRARALEIMGLADESEKETIRSLAIAPLDDVEVRLGLLRDLYAFYARHGDWPKALEVSQDGLRLSHNSTSNAYSWEQRRIEATHKAGDTKAALLIARELSKQPNVPAEIWLARAELLYADHCSLKETAEIREAIAAASRTGAGEETLANAMRAYLPKPLQMGAMAPRLESLGFKGWSYHGVEFVIPPTCHIPAGPFVMGDNKDSDCPRHIVLLDRFDIAKYAVTVAEYACAVRAGVVKEPSQYNHVNWEFQLQQPDHPVVCIHWTDAVTYARWLSQLTGDTWYLPSEAEWEKAARGTDGRLYPWGNAWDQTKLNTYDSNVRGTSPIGSYAKGTSPYGVYEMAGNVMEWTASVYAPYPYHRDRHHEDTVHESLLHVRKGGSWIGVPELARSAYRYASHEYFGIDDGFRLACRNN